MTDQCPTCELLFPTHESLMNHIWTEHLDMTNIEIPETGIISKMKRIFRL